MSATTARAEFLFDLGDSEGVVGVLALLGFVCIAPKTPIFAEEDGDYDSRFEVDYGCVVFEGVEVFESRLVRLQIIKDGRHCEAGSAV